jgi:hypothetical protein
MNERIRELYEQAMEWVPNQVDPDTKIRLLNADKFAELIIQDTIKLLQQEWYDLNNAPPVEGESARDVSIRVGRKSEVIALMSKVSKHFGVEE